MAEQKQRRQQQNEPGSQPSAPEREESHSQQTQGTRGGDQSGRMDTPDRDRSTHEPSSIADDRGVQSTRDRGLGSDSFEDELDPTSSRESGVEDTESIEDKDEFGSR